MNIHSVQNFSTQWQKNYFHERKSRMTSLGNFVLSALTPAETQTSVPENKKITFENIRKEAEEQRLPKWTKIAYLIASWITQYIFRSHHVFYEEMLALDLKAHSIQKLAGILDKFRMDSENIYAKSFKGQLVAIAQADGKDQIHAYYRDLKAAQEIKIVLADLEAIKTFSGSDFRVLTDHPMNACTKKVLIDGASRKQNHSLADQIQHLRKLNPVVIGELLKGNPRLIDQIHSDYDQLATAFHHSYGAFSQAPEVTSPDESSPLSELAELLQKPGNFARALNSDLDGVYDVSIERLAGIEGVEAIAKRVAESKIRVTHLGVELAPFLKQGGLGEALQGLTQAMAHEGAQVRVLFPLYSSIKANVLTYKGIKEKTFRNDEGENIKTYTIEEEGVQIVFFEHKDFLITSENPTIYDTEIRSRARFAKFNQCAAAWLYQNKENIDVIHLHDWHVATVAKLLATKHPKDWAENKIPAVTFSLHNISKAAQGRTNDLLVAGAYAYGLGIIPMLDALKFCDMTMTVSRVFAEEIQLIERGEGLDAVMRHLAATGRLVGVLNGSNPEKWNPATDRQLESWKLLPESAPIDLRCGADDPQKLFDTKTQAKKCFALWLDQQRPLLGGKDKQTQLFNKIDASKPLFAVVTRYDSHQKGLDFYEYMIDAVIAEGGQIAIVGSQEDSKASEILNHLVRKYAKKDGVVIIRDEKLSKGYRYQQGTETNAPMGSLVRFASDVMFMTPSYEPSGLTQFEGWGFGALAFSSNTGGLSECIKTPQNDSENFNGWLFNRAGGKRAVNEAVNKAMAYFKGSSPEKRAEKMAFVMKQAGLYGWGTSSPELRQSPVRQHFVVYAKAQIIARNRGSLTLSIVDRLKTVTRPVVERLTYPNPKESKMALHAFLGAGAAGVETIGPLVRGMPIAFGEGINTTLHEQLGAHKLANGSFRLTVMAPRARSVAVILYNEKGDENITRSLERYDGGIWQRDISTEFPQGTKYRLLINGKQKLDPYGRAYARLDDRQELFNVLYHDDYKWSAGNAAHIAARAQNNKLATANVFEIFPQTWAVEHNVKTWSALAPSLIEHAKANGYTHIELMGVLPFPYIGSMGYQVIGHFAPDYRLGSPEEFKKLVDLLHQAHVGVIVDFIPGHIAADKIGPTNFDGSPLYEISGLEKVSAQAMIFHKWGHHMNLSSKFVQSHLLSAANWLMEQNVDGLRVDAILSLLIHHDPGSSSRFMQHLNGLIKAKYPHCFTVAEDYSGQEKVLDTFEKRGLGFDAKWNTTFKHHAMMLLQKAPEHSSFSLISLIKEQSSKQAKHLFKYFSHDELRPDSSSLLELVQVSGANKGRSYQNALLQKKCAKLANLFALVRLLPGPSLVFMGADSFSNYRWKAMNPHESYKEENNPIAVTEELDRGSKQAFYQGLQTVVALIGEQISCKIQHTAESQAAVTYKLRGRNINVLVLVNFSEHPYISCYKKKAIEPAVLPMSLKVLKLDDHGKAERELWHTASSIPYIWNLEEY